MHIAGYRAPGAPLVRFLQANGYYEAAVAVAYKASLITDEDLERAYTEGTDVLARVDLTPVGQ
jgi:hypothetical protein